MPPDSIDGSGDVTERLNAAVESIIHETEVVQAGFELSGHLVRADGNGGERRTSNVGMLVTTERLLFVPTDGRGVASESDVGVLRYHNLARVSVDDGGDRLRLGRTDGVEWHVPLPEPRSSAVDATVRHLRWIGDLRSRIVACRNDVDLADGEIRDHAAGMEWEEGADCYRRIRDRLDSVVVAVQLTEPIATDDLAPRLTELERTLETAYATLQIERARSELTLSQQLVGNGDYEQAVSVLSTARSRHETARYRAEAVERGDAFRFGRQRELDERLERLGWEIEAVGAEPLRQAHEAKILAQSASDPSDALDHWETAYRRYGAVLALDLNEDDRYIAGDPDDVRAEMAGAGEALIDHHRGLAGRAWQTGIADFEAGEDESALRSFDAVRDHLERARELAERYRPDLVPEYEDRLEQLADVERIACEREGSRTEGDGRISPGADQVGGSTENDTDRNEDGRSEPTLNTLANVDSHQEILLEDLGGGEVSAPESAVDADDWPDRSDDGIPDRVVESDSN